jgi:hypothetical protein
MPCTPAPLHPHTPAPWLAVGAFDVLGKVSIRAFGSDAAFFAGDDLSGILDPVEHTVMDFLHDIVDGNRGTGVVEVTAASVTSGGRKQGSVGSEDIEAEKPELFDHRGRNSRTALDFFEVLEVLEVRFHNQTTKTSKTSKRNEGVYIGSHLDCRIDFAELSDNIADRELGEFAHLKTPGFPERAYR